jgi:hypothetical protein
MAVFRAGEVTGTGAVEHDTAARDCNGAGLGERDQAPRDCDGGGLSGAQPPGHPNPNSEIGNPGSDGPRPPLCEESGGAVARVGAMGAPAEEPPTGGGFRRREENALLEMEQEVFREIERLKSLGAPVDDILKEVLSASAELHAYLEQQHPP